MKPFHLYLCLPKKECTVNNSRQIFRVFLIILLQVKLLLLLSNPSVRTDSQELSIHCKRDQVFRDKCLYLEKSGIDWKKFQKLHPEPFLTNFQTFYSFCHRSNFSLYLSNPRTELTHKSCSSSGSLTKAFKIRVLGKVPKAAPRAIFNKFSVVWIDK